MGCVYQAKNLITGKLYIGKTVKSLSDRVSCHISNAKGKSDLYFHKAIRKYGIDSFQWSILYQGDKESQLYEMEQMFIKQLNTMAPLGYNLTAGGDGMLEPTNELRTKLSKAQMGHIVTEETKGKLRAANLGKTVRICTEETLKKMSERMLGNKYGLGRICSPEERARISKMHKGRQKSKEERANLSKGHLGEKPSDETKRKMSASRKGYKHSEETKRKIRIALTGKKRNAPSQETRMKQSLAMKGRPQSAETIQKMKGAKRTDLTRFNMSEAAKLRWAEKKRVNKLFDIGAISNAIH